MNNFSKWKRTLFWFFFIALITNCCNFLSKYFGTQIILGNNSVQKCTHILVMDWVLLETRVLENHQIGIAIIWQRMKIILSFFLCCRIYPKIQFQIPEPSLLYALRYVKKQHFILSSFVYNYPSKLGFYYFKPKCVFW